jgi:hypothetical protein
MSSPLTLNSVRLNTETTAETETLIGVVNVFGQNVSCTGYDPLAPAHANSRSADFDVREVDGPRAFIKVDYKRIVDTWIQHRSTQFRTMDPALAKRLHRRVKEILGKDKSTDAVRYAFQAAWKEIFKEDAPTSAAKFDLGRRMSAVIGWFKQNNIPFDPNWTLEQAEEFRRHPETIASAKAAAALEDERARMAKEEAERTAAETYVGVDKPFTPKLPDEVKGSILDDLNKSVI